MKHTKTQGKNEHFYSDNSCTGYVPPSKAQKRGIFFKRGIHESFLNFLEINPIEQI